jgi:DNA-binding CsgD family transcriptional regulator
MNSISYAEARIKQLCCLGLDGQVIMPTLLAQMHEVVPSYANNFLWSDDKGQISNYWGENMDDIIPLLSTFLSEFSNTEREREVLLTFSEVMHGRQVVITLEEQLKVDRRTFYRHDYYNLMLRPAGYHKAVNVVVREGGRGLGIMSVHRSQGEAEFTHRDKSALAAIMPFIAHGVNFSARDDLNVRLVEDEDHGLAIVNQDGKLQYASPHARKLLFLATHPQVTQRAMQGEAARLPAEVIRLCQNLVAVFEGKQGPAAPPVHHCLNPWGGFTFRAYWLDNANPLASLIGITIEHQVPLAVKVIRNMEHLAALSRRQMQICLLIATGHSHAEIARRMDVTVNTAITHSRRIYNKLDVNNRAELMDKLLGR